MPTTVNVPGRGTLTFDDNVSDAEIQQIVQKEFPINGEDVVRSIAEDPSYAQRMSRDDFMEMRRYKDDKPIEFSTKLAEAFGGIGELVSNAFTTAPKFDPQAGPIEKGVSLVANIGQGAMVGAGDFANMFLGMVEGYSNDNNSYTRYRLANDLKDTPENKAAYDQIIDKDFENFKGLQTWQQSRKDILGQASMPAMAETISLVAQPPLPGAALLEATGVGERIGAMGARAAQMGGKGIQAVGKAASAAAKVPQQVAAAAAKALTGSEQVGGMVEKAVATGSTGLAAGQLGGFAIPGLSTAATTIAGAKAIGKGLEVAGEVTQKLAEHAGKKAGRLGVFESLANDLSASPAARAIGRIGSVAGADVVAPYIAAAARGAAEGAAIGGALGFITDGEEGAAGGMGAGLALGGFGGLAGRGYAQGSGMIRQSKIMNDAVRGIASLDPESRANASRLFDKFIKDGNYEAVAEMVDSKNWLSGDVYFSFINNEQAKAMPAAGGTSFEGITVFPSEITKGKPAIYINVDTVKPGTGFHEAFHGAMRTALGETFGKKFTDVINQTYTPEEKTKFVEDYVKRGGTEEGKQKLRDYLAGNQNLPEEIGAEYFSDFLRRRENRDYLLRGQRTTDGSLIAAAKGAIDYTLSKLGIDYDATGTGYKGMDALASELIKARTDINKSIAQNGKPLAPVTLDKMPTTKLEDWAKQNGQTDVLLKDPATGQVVGVKTEEQVIIGREAVGKRIIEELANVPRGTYAPNDAELEIYQKHLTPEQFAKLTFVSESIKSGNVLNADHFPASAKKGETSVYASRGMTNLDFVPYKIRTTQKGVTVVDYVDLTQLKARFDDIMSRSKILEQWGGDKDAAWKDVIAYTKNLSLGEGAAKPSAELFGPIKRDIINKIYGFVPTKAQISEGAIKNISSLGTNVRAESGTGREQIGKPAYEGSRDTRVVSTMRLDRLGRVADTGRQFSFNENGTYGLSQVNFKPAENLGSAKVNNSDEGFRIITKGNKHSLYAPTGERIGIYDTPGKAETKANVELKNKSEQIPSEIIYPVDSKQAKSVSDGNTQYLNEGNLLATVNFMPAEPTAPESKFYSSRIILAVENSSQGKAIGSQWKATIKNSKLGVNQDEYALTRVEDLEPGKTYTKAEVLDYLRANEVVVKDVTLGGAEYKKQNLNALDQEARRTGDFTLHDQALLQELGNGTHFSQYTLPGAKEGSYREVLLTVPEKNTRQEKLDAITEKSNRLLAGRSVAQLSENERTAYSMFERDFNKIADNRDESGGWRDGHDQYSNIPNPIVRLRINERTTVDGKRMLFIEEVQAPQKKEFEKMPTLFQKNWREIAFKWALRTAADNGFDSVGYTTGKQQAERYDLSKQLSEISYSGSNLKAYDKNGDVTVSKTGVKPEELPDIIGKEAAKKLMEQEPKGTLRTISGLDLNVGGEGLKKLYDQDFRNVVNNLPVVKKSGQKVGPADILADKKGWHLTPPNQTTHGGWMVKSGDYNSQGTRFSPTTEGEAAARAFLAERLNDSKVEVYSINVAPEMRNASVSFMPSVKFSAPEKLPNGQAWSTDNKYRVIQKEGGKYRVYAPTGVMIGVADTLDKSKKLIEKRSR